MSERRIRVVVVVELSDERRRARVQRVLAEHLEHVQRSVYEGWVPEFQVERWQARVFESLDAAAGDRVRCYRLCARCQGAAVALGHPPASDDDVWIL